MATILICDICNVNQLQDGKDVRKFTIKAFAHIDNPSGETQNAGPTYGPLDLCAGCRHAVKVAIEAALRPMSKRSPHGVAKATR